MTEQLMIIVMLIVVGYLLLLLELLVIPGFGVTGIGGFVCLAAGSVLAVRDLGQLTGGLIVAGVIAGTTLILMGIPRTRYGRQIVLRDSLADAHVEPSAVAPGTEGVAESDLRPSGIARFGTRRESVVTPGEFVESGTPVRVINVEGGRVVVEPVTGEAGTTGPAVHPAKPARKDTKGGGDPGSPGPPAAAAGPREGET